MAYRPGPSRWLESLIWRCKPSGPPTEVMNLLIQKGQVCGHGFRDSTNYRLRLLPHCGLTWLIHRTARLRGRCPPLAARATILKETLENRRSFVKQKIIRASYILMIPVLLSSVVAFFLGAILISGQPSEQPFKGFALILTEASFPREDQIELRLRGAETNGLSRHPAVNYDILACGTKPFTAALMLGGDARVNTVEIPSKPLIDPFTEKSQSTVKRTILTKDELDSSVDVQLVMIAGKPKSCPRPYDSSASPHSMVPPWEHNEQFLVFRQYGHLQAPLIHRYSIWGKDGAREWWAWPTIGVNQFRANASDPDYFLARPGWLSRFPADVDEAAIDHETSGPWSLPEGIWIPSSYRPAITPDLADGIDAGVFTLEARIDTARPLPSAGSRISWDLDYPAAPVLKVTDTDRLNYLQNLQVIYGFLVGIATSVFASILVTSGATSSTATRSGSPGPDLGEQAQPPATQQEEHSDQTDGLGSTTYRRPPPWTTAALLVMALFGFWRRLRRRDSS
jgi:hypothetical protein